MNLFSKQLLEPILIFKLLSISNGNVKRLSQLPFLSNRIYDKLVLSLNTSHHYFRKRYIHSLFTFSLKTLL